MTTAKTNLFYSLNMLLNEQDAIDELREYLTNGTYPDRFPDESQRKRYDKKFKKFELRGNDIFFKPLSLKVINKNQVQATLKKEFKDNGLGKGVVALYKHIQTKYIGIRRDDVKDYLATNAQYQIAQPQKHRVNKPILASEVGELFAVDLIDMSLKKKNSDGYRYIFSCVDVFSRYSFVEPIKTKTAMATRGALLRIIQRGKVKPRSILMDNRTEFKGIFQNYCENNDINLRHTRTYTPQANSIVERYNKEVRKILTKINARDQTLIWHTKLKEVEDAKNTTYHSSIKTTPKTVWDAKDANDVPVYEDRVTKRNINQQTLNNLETRAEKLISKFEETEFEKGDVVRVLMSVVFSDVRKLIKQGLSKQLVIWYVPRLFKIRSVIKKARDHLERSEYTLRDIQTGAILAHPKSHKPKRVYASQLIETDATDISEMTEVKALALNQARKMPGIDLILWDP